MPKVFISHSSCDKLFAEKLALDLKRRGIGVWLDKWEIRVGDSLRGKIFEEGIGKSDFVVVVLSESSLQSDWVQRELDSSFSISMRNKKAFILPLLLDVSPKDIPVAFADLRAADFRRDYEHGIKDLLAAITGRTQKSFATIFDIEKFNVISIKEKEPYTLGHLAGKGDLKGRDPRLHVRTGVIIADHGIVLTKAKSWDPPDFERYSVVLKDGTLFNNIDCLYVDLSTYTALIKVPYESMAFSSIGNSDTVSVGDEVVSIHNPLIGYKNGYRFRVLRITSEIIDDEKRFLGIGQDISYSEIDCGSPIFNSCGDLIGIVNRPVYYLRGVHTEPKILCINNIMVMITNYLHKPYEKTKGTNSY